MYILVRLIVMSVLCFSFETLYILHILNLTLALFDICVYISSSRAFYVLLKGRRDEALYHSSRSDYLEKKRIVNNFFYTQIFTYFGLIILSLNYIFIFITNTIEISVTIYVFHSFQFLPAFFFSWPMFPHLTTLWFIFPVLFPYLLALWSLLTYFLIFMNILLKLFIRRKKFNHVNDWLTRPLMERYRSSLERRRTQQRPPFIQAFRSHLVY